MGSTDQITVSDWFRGDAYKVDWIEAGDGRMIDKSGVQSLVSSMASYAAPSFGETSLDTPAYANLQPYLDSAWLI